VALAGICVITGVVPALLTALAQQALHMSRGGLAGHLADAAPLSVTASGGVLAQAASAGFAPLALGAAVVAALVVAWGLSRLGSAARRASSPWLCGYVTEDDRVRYTAHGLYSEVTRPIRRLRRYGMADVREPGGGRGTGAASGLIRSRRVAGDLAVEAEHVASAVAEARP
jgi:hypothetical protein